MITYMALVCTIVLLCACSENKTQRNSQALSIDPTLTVIDTSKVDMVRSQNPHSSAIINSFSYEEGKEWEDEIYNMILSGKCYDWKNPTTGGAIHINKKDEIEVYQSLIYQWAYQDTSMNYCKKITPQQIWDYVRGINFSNPTSVLITSEYDVEQSRSLKLIMKELFKPGIQIYYLEKMLYSESGLNPTRVPDVP